MIEYQVKDANFTVLANFSFDKDGELKQLVDSYFIERQKYFEKQKAAEANKKVDDTPKSNVKISLDTAPLDDAIKKADDLISKLKTVQLLINMIK